MDNFISQKSTEYADSKLDKDCPYSKNVQRKERQFDWADIADAFEAGARWARQNPEYKPTPVEYVVEDVQNGQPCELCPFLHITNKDCSLLFKERFGAKCSIYALRFVDNSLA